MRRLSAPLTCFALMFLSVIPVSGQTVSDLTLQITNPAGSISSCPVTVNFVATISMNWPASTPLQSRTVQYKWINSAGIDEPTQTLNFFIPGLQGTYMPLLGTPQIKNSWKVPAGSFWEALQISYPVNLKSPQRNYVVTCPTPGTLSLPATLQGPGVLSRDLVRP